ncbi:MAG: tetratricopeptide repeat protein [Candidatus Marinimicrobia bacterium]|nr:tetratricopeptide repeat protein [Candidatus Neomarinimicrobiota bacterium]
MNLLNRKNILKITAAFLLFSTLVWAQASDSLIEANELYLAGKYSEAKTVVEPIVENDPEYAGAVFLLGRVYYKLGDLDKAKELIDKAIELDLSNPDYREVRNEMAAFASKLTEASRLSTNADYENAKKIYLDVINENPNFVDAYVNLGRVLVRLNDLEQAAVNFRKAIEKDPENESYKKEFEGITRRYIHEGSQLMQRKSYGAALEKFKQAISLNPDNPLAYYYSAVVYLEEKKSQDALDAINKSIQLDPEYPKAHLVKGKIFSGMNNVNGAVEAFKKAIELDAEYVDAWKNIGYIYYKTKKYDEAIPAYKEVTKLQPQYASAYANMGAIYIQQEKFSTAIPSLSKATELNPRDNNSLYRLSQAYNKTGKCDKAKETAQKALKLKPNWAPVLFELGTAERCMGNRTAARQAFQMAARDPKWKAAAEYELKTVQ